MENNKICGQVIGFWNDELGGPHTDVMCDKETTHFITDANVNVCTDCTIEYVKGCDFSVIPLTQEQLNSRT